MAIQLKKGQKIDLRKNTGETLTNFCVGVNWGAIEKSGWFSTKVINVDLDLSCIMLDAEGQPVDHIYSPEYNMKFLNQVGLPAGKLHSVDGSMRHSGDDREGDVGGDDGLDNEVVTVDLTKVSSKVNQIYFFLNNVGQEDFSQIPFAKIRMYEGTASRVNQVQATFDVVSDSKFANHRAMIMGKLYRRNGEWRFHAIGDPTEDNHIGMSVHRIINTYAK